MWTRTPIPSSVIHTLVPPIMSSLITLPLDVYLEILSQFDRHWDASTLKALALTCSSFRIPSQQRLFWRLCIPERDSGKTELALLKLLEKSPSFSSYFREVTYSLDPDDPEPIVTQIIQQLDNVGSIELCGTYYFGWSVLFPLWQSSVFHFIPSTVRHLKVSKIKNFPSSHLMQLQDTLESLTLLDVTLEPLELPSPYSSTNITPPHCKIASPQFQFSSMKELSITWNDITAQWLDSMPVLERFHCNSTFSNINCYISWFQHLYS